MKKIILSIIGIFSLMVFFSPRVLSQEAGSEKILQSEKKVITAVEVSGNKSISLSTILAKIKARAGQEYSQQVISDDLKRLYNTGYFEDVRVDQKDHENGSKVIFYLEEKPIVDKITFSKLRYYKPAHLLRKIRTKSGKFLDNKTMRDDIQTIKELYEKKGLTLVNINTEQDLDELTNKVKVHFVIAEGQRIKVKRIVFTGNESFRSKRLLKVIKSRKDGLFNSGYLKEKVLEEDIQRIKAFYEKEGFIDVQVSHELEEQKKAGSINIKISVTEGKQYFVDEVTLQGNALFTKERLLEQMKQIKPGSIFSRDRLSLDLADIRSLYFDEGYIFANIRESMAINPETGKVAVHMDIYEGDPAYVNKIKIQGNERTRDIVIRRELRLYPGDKFDGSKLRRSKERLRNLGYFNEITYDTEDTDVADHKDLIVQVEEAKTGSFNFGGGYSTVDSLVGFAEIEQKNFDFTNWPTFTGAGQQVLLRTEMSGTRSNFLLSFTEPWIMDYPISGGFDLFLNERDKDEHTGYAYDESRAGGKLRLGKQLSEYVDVGTYYKLENVDISNFDDDVSADLLKEEGENVLSVGGFSWERDKRDNKFNPTSGLYLNSGLDVGGGPFMGDKDFYRLNGKASYDVPLSFQQAVLEFRLQTGISDAYGDSDYVPIYERYFTGGSRSIRGYDERDVGPHDSVTNDPIGGNSVVVGNVEVTVPVLEFMKLAAFYDVGNVWAQKEDLGQGGYMAGAGMGLRFKTPIGPINLDYGYPLDEMEGESKSGKFYFSVSRGF